MDLSPIGKAVLVAREGRRLHAYRDSVGIWTIGIGHTSAAGPPLVTPGLALTPAECDAVFDRDVVRFVAAVRAAVPAPLPQHAFDALVSLCFNIGPAALGRSTLVRRLNAGDAEGAAQAMMLWDRPAALIPRRGAEQDQFRTPYAVALPRARRNDAPPIAMPDGTAPARPVARRAVPRSPGAPPAVPLPSEAAPTWLSRIRAALGGRSGA
nr:lysozyme [Methylobacterium sp. OTU13CASTA1]